MSGQDDIGILYDPRGPMAATSTAVPAHSTLANGLHRSAIDAMLRAAEPHRLHALSSSLNLTAIAAMAAMAVWRLSQHLWPDVAIAAIAPVIGESCGAKVFCQRVGAADIQRRLGDLFSLDGTRYTAWQSHERYRDVVYRLNEATIWQSSCPSTSALSAASDTILERLGSRPSCRRPRDGSRERNVIYHY
jgi:hypothetical protein